MKKALLGLCAGLLMAFSVAEAANYAVQPFATVSFYEDLKTGAGVGLKGEIKDVWAEEKYLQNINIFGGFEFSDSELEIRDQNKKFQFERDFDVDITYLFLGAEYEHEINALSNAAIGIGPEFAFLSSDNGGDFDNGVGLKVYGEYTRVINPWANVSFLGGYRFMEVDFDAGQSIHFFATRNTDIDLSGVYASISGNIKF